MLAKWRERIVPFAKAAAGKWLSAPRKARRLLATKESARPGAASGEPKMVWAVPCDCTAGDRTERVLAKARVPERYRHCDFENYETDNEIENTPSRNRMRGAAVFRRRS